MAEDQDKENQTEDPSDRKLEKAAEKGDTPRSQDLNSWFVLAGGTLAIMIAGGSSATTMRTTLAGMLAHAHAISFDGAGLSQALGSVGLSVAAALGLPMILLLLAGLAGPLSQNLPRLSSEPLMPKLQRISPMAGVKRLFGMEALVQFAKGLVKISAMAVLVGAVLWPERKRLESLVTSDVLWLMPVASQTILHLMGAVLAVFAFIAAADYGYQRFSWMKRQRMTKQEVKEEHKESEGSPEIKARRYQLRMRNRKKNMKAEIAKATAVIMNPTHFAVALRYEKGMPAPICVAKGQDLVALRIRSIAEESRVPVVVNPPLARALYKAVDLDQEIPVEHYKAVAEVIGFVLRLRGRGR